ncbi:hypothetical protein [Natrialba sp. SSL1]|uniref:hypothetical protein n=1 Tax=Natrialba sp. SSL1 TaxID=1869245 RepID=UPI0008F8B58E|nr:hypothetical protein [Natrialba sp. SSL1]OIB57233.1 hypothetical protein BBD46_16010 [Natrialba sp. SSL1]
MSDDSSHSSTGSASTSGASASTSASASTILGGIGRVVADAIIVAAFVLFLTLWFLQTGWPRWAFYAALFLGVAGYVSITRPW